MFVYMISVSCGGPGEPSGIYSIWSTKEAAEQEKKRMLEVGIISDGEEHLFEIVPIELDKPGEEYFLNP